MGRSKWDIKDDQDFWADPHFEWAAARGLIGNAFTHHQYGHMHNLGANEATVWNYGGLYPYPSASVLTVTSTDAGDTVAGVGARTVTVFGLSTDYALATTTLNMAGATTGAVTTTKFQRVYRAMIREVGSSGENLGHVYVGSGAISSGEPANVWAMIEPGRGQSQQAVYTVPADHTAYVTHFRFGVGNASRTIDASFFVRPINESWQIKYEADIYQGNVQESLRGYFAVPEMSDIEIRAEATTSNTKVSGGFDLVLIKG